MSLKISRILHAGYIFECGDTQIAFDPIFENPFSRNCHAFPDVKFDHEQIGNLQLDAVFISHFHDDHCSLESLNFLHRETPIYIYCLFEELFSMIKELGFVHVYALELDVPVRLPSFEVIPRRALDSDVDSMFHVKAAGLNILNVVDSWIDPSTLLLLTQHAPWDMILWPFQTMREIEVIAPSRATVASLGLPEEWLPQLKALQPRYVVPSSCQFAQEPWSWYNHAFFPITYQKFQQVVESALSETKVVRLNPSVTVILDKTSLIQTAPLSWVIPVGEQNADYEYKKDLKPPKTAEISRHFAELSAAQKEKVSDYCRRGLIEKYNSLEAPLDAYFEKPRRWRLSVYDQAGRATDLHYLIDGAHIETTTDLNVPLAWTTEIPAAKIYAALELGESLTSMYMRINDVVFDAEIEKEISAADIVEDPLIRCLFTGAFGAYQRAQLKRLKKTT